MRFTAIFLASLLVAVAALRAQPAVTLEAASDRKFYRRDAENDFRVEARVLVDGPTGQVPAGRNLAFVLDGSGSMAGERIQALREAMAATLKALNPVDRVSVILFGSEVETIIEARSADQIRDPAAALANLQPAGGAALYDALNQAAALLRRHAEPATLSQLVLVTDGPPTKGPRAADDFVRLAGVFATEGFVISTIGLGEDFDEDMLAAMARTGGGRFSFAEKPADLRTALAHSVQQVGPLAGLDAELSIRFLRTARKVESLSLKPATLLGSTVSFRFHQLWGGQRFSFLAAAEIDPFLARADHPEFVSLRLQWKDPATGETRELVRTLPLNLIADSTAIRESLNPVVARLISEALVRESLQDAIEALDKGDARRALRGLRSAGSDIRALNYELNNAALEEVARHLDIYLATLPSTGLAKRDRKVLRSGLRSQFEPPFPADEPKK